MKPTSNTAEQLPQSRHDVRLMFCVRSIDCQRERHDTIATQPAASRELQSTYFPFFFFFFAYDGLRSNLLHYTGRRFIVSIHVTLAKLATKSIRTQNADFYRERTIKHVK